MAVGEKKISKGEMAVGNIISLYVPVCATGDEARSSGIGMGESVRPEVCRPGPRRGTAQNGKTPSAVCRNGILVSVLLCDGQAKIGRIFLFPSAVIT